MPSCPRLLALPATLGLLVVVACGATRPPVTKIVGNRIIVTRSVSAHAYEHAARAMMFEQAGRYDEAAAEYQRALAYDDEAAELHARLAEVFIALDRLNDADAEIQRSLAIVPTVDALRARAHLALRRGEPPGAAVALREAAAMTSFDEEPELAEEVRLELADTQVMALRLDDAGATLEGLLRGLPAAHEARFRLAALRWAQGHERAAETALRQLLSDEPNYLEAHLMLAWLAVAIDQPALAHQAFRNALDRAEGSLEVAGIYARWLMASSQVEKAHALADELAADAASADHDSLLGRMELERIVDRHDVALQLSASLLKSDPGAALLGRLRLAEGAVLADAKRDEPAVAALLAVPEDAPAFRESRLRAAAILRESGALDKARGLLGEASNDALDDDGRRDLALARAQVEDRAGDAARALRILDDLGPELGADEQVLFMRATIEEHRGHWQKTLALAEQVLARDPGNAQALNLWGFVAADHDHALDTADKRTRAALVFEPAAGAILDSIGWAAFRAGRLDEAAHFLGQAARLEAEDPEVLGHLAALQETRGERPAAVTTLKKALLFAREERVRRELEAQLGRLQSTDAAHRQSPPTTAQ